MKSEIKLNNYNKIISEIHDKYYGVQDKYGDKKDELYKYTGDYIKTEKILMNNDEEKESIINIFKLEDSENGYGYTNLRILGDPKNIKYVELSAGCSRLDKIYPSLFGHLSFDCFTRCIMPALLHHNYVLNILYIGTIEIEFDIYKINNYIEKEYFWFKQCQFTGIEHIKINIKSKVRLNFNHPVFRLFVLSESNLVNLHLSIEDGDNKYVIPYSHKEYNKYVFDFNNTINFSRIDNIFLKFDPLDNDVELAIYSDNFQMAMCAQGMIGLLYSK